MKEDKHKWFYSEVKHPWHVEKGAWTVSLGGLYQFCCIVYACTRQGCHGLCYIFSPLSVDSEVNKYKNTIHFLDI